MKTKTIETKVFSLSLCVIFICEAVIVSVILSSQHSPLQVLATGRLLELGFLLTIVSAWGQGLTSIGLVPGKTIFGLKRGLFWSACFGCVVLLLFALLYVMHLSPSEFIRVSFPLNLRERVLFFIVGALVAPIAEEVFFRGIVYGYLRRWGVLLAVLGTTLIFVGAHTMRAGMPLSQAVGGVVFAIAYEIEGNLLVPATIHVLGNTAIFSLCLWG